MSGSTATASTRDSPGAGMLRRKVSSIGRPTARAARTESSVAREKAPVSSKAQDQYSDTVLGIAMPSLLSTMEPIDEERRSMLASSHQLQGLPHQLNTDDLPPPTPAYALSASPSTRYSESPGRFSHTSSPTSMSSHSPGVVFPSKLGPRQRQNSPTRSRPPVTRRKTDDNGSTNDLHGLPSLHESTASSSSSSTVLAPASDRRQLMLNTEKTLAPPSSLKREVSPSANRVMCPPERSSQITVETRISVQSTREAAIYPPPELAHLADTKSPQKSAGQRPLRPSREGTPDLSGLQGGPSPVVQSNLTRLPMRHRRQTSSGSGISPLSADTSRRPSFSTSPNPSVGSTFSPVSAHISTTRGTTPDQQPDDKKSSSVPPSPNKGTSRFGFFSKRTKSEGAPAPPRKEKKLVRKGPMAGTGHEGYGKYGVGRGRSTSSTSVTSSYGRSASQDSITSNTVARPSASRKSSLKSEPEMDGFLRDRLNPKVLRGEGSAASSVRGNSEGDRSATSLDSMKDRPGMGSLNNSSVSVAQSGRPSADSKRPSLLPSAMADPGRGTSPFRVAGLPGTIRRPTSSDSSLSVNLLPSSTQRTEKSSGKVAVAPEESSTGRQENRLKKKKEPESKPTRKWNFFQRAQSAPKPEPKPKPQSPPTQQMPAAVSGPVPSRSVAHYAIDDAQDQINMEDLERLMEEAERLGYESSGSRPPSLYRSSTQSRKHGNSILLPSPPVLSRPFGEPQRPASPKVLLRNTGLPDFKNSTPAPKTVTADIEVGDSAAPAGTPIYQAAQPENREILAASPPPRPSRLQQVGRIPQVVSTRDRSRKIPPQSFSRPFVPVSSPPTSHLEQIPQDTAIEFSATERQDAPGNENTAPLFVQDTMPQPLSAESVTTPDESGHAITEFFSFPPRKYSELSYTSSSGVSSFPPSTAVIPAVGAPPQEDEVWNEYDDLIDEVLSSPESHATKRRDRPVKRRSRTSSIAQDQHPQQLPQQFGDAGDRTTVFEEDISPRTSVQVRNSTAASVHLRRSRLLAAFQSLATPSSAGTSSGFPQDEAAPASSLIDQQTARLSLPSMRLSLNSLQEGSARSSVQQSTEQETVSLQPNAEPVEAEPAKRRVHFRDSRLIEIAENTKEGLASMAELRYGALMVSKWLSFGRVLFSPAHFELKNSFEDRILVLDGLGQDWSYYCALTYPTAQVYYLNPIPNNTSTQPGPVAPAPNYRQIHHPDLLAPFPFPKGFFAAVVFRFPTAAPEAVFRAAISECKRVLRPGGHLEVSVVDLDLVNMGNRARRAVRDLKMRMQSTDPEVCLMNASDAFQRLIGRRGFENLSRCIVGVPTAGKMPKSVDLTNQAGGSSSTNGMPSQARFGDFAAMSDKEPSSSDDGISKMISRVGRWWYSRCYESMVLEPEGDLSHSIWSDDALLYECEKRQASFRLLICYAQKPTVTRRRTVSV
ncbi:hypothetical protein B0J12DRAFT_740746 [Macrophomina phaseolina]|uniref:Methyltransferase type 11 n=1 Tax=Macrophomina phaseolina TaxID=35725 RepID=A0ABQ8G9K1_9PEZI|nr:hypothetical protein B0J12DRAFT_740746 [Macrophomina phaseolina]